MGGLQKGRVSTLPDTSAPPPLLLWQLDLGSETVRLDESIQLYTLQQTWNSNRMGRKRKGRDYVYQLFHEEEDCWRCQIPKNPEDEEIKLCNETFTKGSDGGNLGDKNSFPPPYFSHIAILHYHVDTPENIIRLKIQCES